MTGAPNTIKHPSTTVSPRRASMRPESISNPQLAIASTPRVVAIDPSSRASIQLAAGVNTLCADGSDNEAPSRTKAAALTAARFHSGKETRL